jgi:hypothetical protein
MDMTPQQQILADAIKGRDAEILLYQVNIDNFIEAINLIDSEYADNPDLAKFREELQERLDEERRQQLRAIVIRRAIAAQLPEDILKEASA